MAGTRKRPAFFILCPGIAGVASSGKTQTRRSRAGDEPVLSQMSLRLPSVSRRGEKKPARRPVFQISEADYLVAAAAEAASDAATEAAAAASAAVEAAAEAAAAASAAGAAASAAGATTVVSVVAAGAVSTTGAGAAGVSSAFLEQAARATAIRETISRDFFMGFPFLIQK
jgi:hypothetical protein